MRIVDFISKDEEIERLNKQLSMVAKFYDDFYKTQVSKYKYKINELNRANKRLRRRADKYKAIPKAIQNKSVLRAKEMIILKSNGFSDLTLEEIAEQCFATISTVKRISIEVNNDKL
tara:strand:- start:104 stop:454 length:351 start_codon:yes stop_codon:yes gene_type:complete